MSLETEQGAAYQKSLRVQNAVRVAMIVENALALGVPDLAVEQGQAPDALTGLARPDAVFIGGGTGDGSLLDACWMALKPGGRFVANAVTVSGEAALLAQHAGRGGDLVRLAISRAEPLAGAIAWRSLRPVTQWAAVKR